MHPLESIVVTQKEHTLVPYIYGKLFNGSQLEYAEAMRKALISFECRCGEYNCPFVRRYQEQPVNNKLIELTNNIGDYLLGYTIGVGIGTITC